MEITVWNSAKSRLETIDIEFTDDDTTWFEESEEGKSVQTLTDIDDRLLIKEHGYNYPVLFPDGHPKSPTCGHLKIPHPQHLPEI